MQHGDVMSDDDRTPRVIDLSPQLNYARPDGRPRWQEYLEHAFDLFGGWLGVTLLAGLYAIVLAPHAPGVLAGLLILAGIIILHVAIVLWLKQE